MDPAQAWRRWRTRRGTPGGAAGRADTAPAPAPARPEGTSTRPWRTEGLPPEEDGRSKEPDRRRRRRALVWVLVAYWVVFAVLTAQDQRHGLQAVSYTEFAAQVEADNIAEVFARGDSIEGTLRQPRQLPDGDGDYQRFHTARPAFAQDDLLAQLRKGGAVVRATPVDDNRGTVLNLLLSFGPILLLVGFYLWLLRRQSSLFGGGLLSRQRKPVDPESVRATFDDVAGIDEVEAEIAEIVDFLRQPEKYRRLGARAPKGVLLAGPPGTGKTLLARATAGEAEVPFFSASASEFIEMVVGVGASRVRELFAEARKVAPAIIFIDEIDTIGRARGGGPVSGGHDEREQTLNQILTEMDGFTGSEGVVVLAATNRPDILDPALVRPGRFDRTITVSPPDQKGRLAILAVHTRQVPLAGDVDLAHLARTTPGMTGAQLANLVNEAALAAARRDREQVTAEDFSEALEKIQLGTARTMVMPAEERRRTAYHEAGHALLGMLQPGADPVRKVSIIPRGRALGVTLSTPEDDRYGYDEQYLRGRIVGALGGMAAEDVVFGVITTGAESDLETATGIARAMVGRWGMSERVGPVSVLPREGDPRALGVSESLLTALDDEVRQVISECYDRARTLLAEHRDRLERIVTRLLEQETLDEAEIYAAAGLSRRREPISPIPREHKAAPAPA